MKPLTENEVREIVREEMTRNYMSGSPDVPPHSHNGTDALNVSPVDLEGFTPMPTSRQTYLNPVTGLYEYGFASTAYETTSGLVGGTDAANVSQYVANASVAQYPIPIVVGNGVGAQSAFNGGYAPEGTLVFFANGTASVLYIRFDGGWLGANFNLTA